MKLLMHLKMALFLEGQTTCPICNKIIIDTAEAVLFPAFIPNIKDDMYLFSDSTVHEYCLINHRLGTKAIVYRDFFLKGIPSISSVCIVDNKIIKNPKDILFLGLLTSNDNEKLAKYNFVTLNKKNVFQWDFRDYFIEVSTSFLQEGKWKSEGGNMLEYVLLNN